MSFIDDLSNVLFPDKIATGALPAGKDPRTVPQASNFNDLKTAVLELRSAVLGKQTTLTIHSEGYVAAPDELWVLDSAIAAGDTTAPVVSAVSAGTASAASVNLTITATDNVAVTGYLGTLSAVPPAAGAAGWSGSNTVTVAGLSVGSNEVYGWAKDGAGNVSAADTATHTPVTYTLPQAAAPTFSPAAGSYSSAQTVALSTTTPGGVIHYTTDDSTPTAASPTYSTAITVSVTETVKALTVATGYTDSTVASATYTITISQVAAPTFGTAAGTYDADQSVTLSCATSGAAIHYTTDGSAPTGASPTYSTAIPVTATTTIKAMATKSGLTDSTVAAATYTLVCGTPTFSPVAGTYSSTQTVTLSSTTAGAAIRYTTDGSTPTGASTLYSTAISVAATGTVKALAIKSGYSNSAIGSAAYTITLPQVATPTFSPDAGTYSSTQTVTISCATSGASIYYTTDGSTPTTGSTAYSAAISVAATETLKALATKSGYTDSAVGSAAYTISGGTVGVVVAASAAAYGDSTAVVTPPTGIANGDILLMVAQSYGIDDAVCSDAGFTLVSGLNYGGADFSTSNVWWKRASGTQASVTVYGGLIFARMFVVRGCIASGSPINASSGGAISGTTQTGAALTSTVANVMEFFAVTSRTNTAATTPGGTIDQVLSASHASGGMVALGYKAVPSNSIGSQAAPTLVMGAAADSSGGKFTFLLKPA